MFVTIREKLKMLRTWEFEDSIWFRKNPFFVSVFLTPTI